MAGIQGLRGTGQFTTDFRPKIIANCIRCWSQMEMLL